MLLSRGFVQPLYARNFAISLVGWFIGAIAIFLSVIAYSYLPCALQLLAVIVLYVLVVLILLIII